MSLALVNPKAGFSLYLKQLRAVLVATGLARWLPMVGLAGAVVVAVRAYAVLSRTRRVVLMERLRRSMALARERFEDTGDSDVETDDEAEDVSLNPLDEESDEDSGEGGSGATSVGSIKGARMKRDGLYISEVAARVHIQMGGRPVQQAQLRAAQILAGRMMLEDGHRPTHVERDLPLVMMFVLSPTRVEEDLKEWQASYFADSPSRHSQDWWAFWGSKTA
jgi:hypothetical protein